MRFEVCSNSKRGSLRWLKEFQLFLEKKPENAENPPNRGHELYPKRRQKSPNPTLADPYSLLKSVLAEKKRTRMGSRTVLIIAMTFTRREKTENKNGFRRFWRAKTPEKAFSGNYTFSARESS